MRPPDPEHLFEQAEHLAGSTLGKPRETDLRRSGSTAYYGLFHTVSLAAARNWSRDQKSFEFALAYRNIDHGRLRTICNAAKIKLSKDHGYFAGYEFGTDLRAVAEIILELQELRQGADYDPLFQIRVSNARLAVARAKTAANRFLHQVLPEEKLTFLTLLMFKSRT